MGQKINPIGFRLGSFYDWSSHWFAGPKKRYQDLLIADVLLRKELNKKLKSAGLTQVEIDRSINQTTIIVRVARPGIVIGRGGTGLEDLKKYIEQNIFHLTKGTKQKIDLKVEPVKEPNLSATFVAQSVADQLIKRLPAKRVLAQTIEKVMTAGALGVKVRLAGRINGAEIARIQHDHAGVLPLSTMRANIDFAIAPAATRSGYIGVKVWIYKKDG